MAYKSIAHSNNQIIFIFDIRTFQFDIRTCQNVFKKIEAIDQISISLVSWMDMDIFLGIAVLGIEFWY